MSLDDIVKALATNTQQFQQEARASIRNLETQMSQIDLDVSSLKEQNSGKLPSQAIANPKENVSAMELRSGKQVQSPLPAIQDLDRGEEKEDENEDVKDNSQVKDDSLLPKVSNDIVAPYLSRLTKNKKEEYD